MWGTFGSMPNVVGEQGASCRKVSQYWQVTNVAGKVPKSPKPKHCAMRGVPLHVYYIQFGQYTQPMGSGRPPWAAGEYLIVSEHFDFSVSLNGKIISYR